MCKCTYINTCVRNGRLVIKANIGTKVNMHKVSVHPSHWLIILYSSVVLYHELLATGHLVGQHQHQTIAEQQ